MLPINKTDLLVRDVFLACAATVHNAADKQNLIDCINILEDAEKDFDQKFNLLQIYQIPQILTVSPFVGMSEMRTVYNYRMVQIEPGKTYYNKIKASAPNGKCPLCSVREVETLDHYLPKTKFPLFAVTPITLIPACFTCNKGKLVDFPRMSHDQTLHPYYDNIDGVSWLSAVVVQSNPITFDYFVNPHPTWTQDLTLRVQNHFKSFQLNELFSPQANEQLLAMNKLFIKLYNLNPILLMEHLQDAYDSTLTRGTNSWQAVMYRTLVNDAWFCGGGVLQ